MIALENTAPVASKLLSHLMGIAGSDPIRFGDPVGVEEPAEIEEGFLAPGAAPPANAFPTTANVATATAQPFAKTESVASIRDWLVGGLGSKRGVLSAWPQAPGLRTMPNDRVLLLNPLVVSGRSWWWLHKFKNTLFSRRDSYRHRQNDTVYRVGGEPAMGWNWFPRGSLYGMDPGTIDAFLHFGLAVTVRELDRAHNAPALEAQVAQCAISIYLELEAATLGVAAPVFAAMLVFDGDDYDAASKELQESNAMAPAPATDPVYAASSANVIGSVVASQMHTFRLSDMLRTYNELRPEDNVLLVQKQIQDATIDLATKIQRMATSKIIKLNMCASNIVFCPHLADSAQGDDWVLLGFGFKTAEDELITGKPFLSEFDPRLCKRMGGQQDYDVNCSFVLMIAVLLATVKAEFGSVYTLMLRALLNQDADGLPKANMPVMTTLANAFNAAKGKSDVFRDVLLRSFQHSRPERDAIPADVFDELVADFVSTLSQPVTVLGSQAAAGQPPRFHKLSLKLLGARSYAPCDTGTVDQLAADQAQARKHRAYITRVIRERQERVRARGNPPVVSNPVYDLPVSMG